MKRYLTIAERATCSEDLRRRYVQWCRTQDAVEGKSIWSELEAEGVVAPAKNKTAKKVEVAEEQLAAEIDALNNN